MMLVYELNKIFSHIKIVFGTTGTLSCVDVIFNASVYRILNFKVVKISKGRTSFSIISILLIVGEGITSVWFKGEK